MPSATQLIKRDHRKVESLFDRFDKAKSASSKKKVCEQVIQELEVHAKLEEEIFYPAVRKHIGEEEMLQEAKQEHQEAKNIMAELKKGGMEDEEFESKFAELVEGVKHHVEEEEGEMLPKVEESDMNLQEYGDEMTQRKKELLNQTGKSRTSTKKSRGTAKGQGSKSRAAKKKSSGRKSKSGGRRRSGRAA
jgi:hemerythrin superfamily protein